MHQGNSGLSVFGNLINTDYFEVVILNPCRESGQLLQLFSFQLHLQNEEKCFWCLSANVMVNSRGK